MSGQTQSCHFEIAKPQTPEPLPLFNVPFLHSLPLLPVIVNSCCVYYKARQGPWSLHHEPQLLSRSTRPHFLGPPCHSGPSWPLGWRTGSCPKGPAGTTLQPRPGMSRNLHPENPGEKSRMLWLIMKSKAGLKNTLNVFTHQNLLVFCE